MRRNDRYRGSVGVAIALTLGAAYARAEYVFTIVDHQTGLPHSTVERADSFSLDFVVSGDEGDEFEWFMMLLYFTPAVPRYDWYALAEPPFVTGSLDDLSEPPDCFEALTEFAGTYFTSGTLLELGLTVPVDFVPNEVRVDGTLEFSGEGWPPPQIMPVEPFILTVVPEPAMLALAGSPCRCSSAGKS